MGGPASSDLCDVEMAANCGQTPRVWRGARTGCENDPVLTCSCRGGQMVDPLATGTGDKGWACDPHMIGVIMRDTTGGSRQRGPLLEEGHGLKQGWHHDVYTGISFRNLG